MSVVLVADDEPALLDVVGDFVEMLGHEVVRAQDGEEALALVQTRRPALVITDHMMPRRTGLALSRTLRGDPGLERTPVIIMSAVHPKGLDAQDVYIKKPFDLRDLERLIERALARRTATEESRLPTMTGDEMVAWVAHAMKAPLETTRAQIERLEERLATNGDERIREEFQRAQRGLARIERLVLSLLDSVRLAEGKVALELAVHDLGPFVEHVVRDVRLLEPSVPLVLELPDVAVEARFDADWMRQVVENVLTNALRHGASPVGVEVSVAARQMAEIAVRDHGAGIAADELPEVFHRFRRGDSSRGGHGLYVAAEIVRLHGGSIDLQSTVGHGTTAVIRLPRP
jgi:two-component system, sensor histidine kinase and response regulator